MRFEETDVYGRLNGEIFRGLIIAAGGTHIGGSGAHDRDESYAFEAGRLAFEVTGGDQQAGGIAMLLNAQISGKLPLLRELLMDGKLTADENQTAADKFLIDENGQAIPYTAIWISDVQEKILERFEGFSRAQQAAILAHTCVVLGRLNDPVDPAPDFIQSSVQAFLVPLAALANKNGLDVGSDKLSAAYRPIGVIQSALAKLQK